jgi:hypothetical protein
VQVPTADVSCTTSQYEPSGRLVLNDVFHALPSLLITTNPLVPAHALKVTFVKHSNVWIDRTSAKGNPGRGGRNPVCHCCGANSVAPANHACDCDPAVLAEPSNQSTQEHRSTVISARTSRFARRFRRTYQCLENVRAAP